MECIFADMQKMFIALLSNVITTQDNQDRTLQWTEACTYPAQTTRQFWVLTQLIMMAEPILRRRGRSSSVSFSKV